MSSNEINVGNRVEIRPDSEESTAKSLVSVVEDVYEDNFILLHVPISYGELVRLQLDKSYNFLFMTEKGIFRYKAKIIKYKSKEKFHFMLVELDGEGKKVQRREYYRHECLLPFTFALLSEDENIFNYSIEKRSFIYESMIKDISAGGIRFLSNFECEVNNIIKCMILLNEEYIICTGNIIHRQNYPKSTYKYQYRVQFVEMEESDKEVIVKYIFNEQRRLRKNIN